MVVLDGREYPVEPGEEERLREIAPRLNGRIHIDDLGLADSDRNLVVRLHSSGAIHDLPLEDDAVRTHEFCDYLYSRISSWRQNKNPENWPWRETITQGKASLNYLQGLVWENYHFVRAASIRQSPLLSVATVSQFNLIRGFVTEEATHEDYFLETLTRWGVPAEEVRASVPLASTAAFIGLQYRLAHKSPLDYLAGSAVLEVDPDVYRDRGDPYQSWISLYGVDPHILEPIRQHIRDDVEGGHASLFRQIATTTAPYTLPLETALSALVSARTVFGATRLWQRDMWAHYQRQGGKPPTAAL